MLTLTFLGTGTSQGVPIIGCDCQVCNSQNHKDKRLRTSALIQWDEHTISIDAGPDFRQQMLRENIQRLDAILLTHAHRDHVGGIDDVRAFNYYQKMPMPVYGNPYTLKGLKETIPYAFCANPYPGVPEFELHTLDNREFKIFDLEIQPIEVMHFKLPVSAYRIANLVYITDANYISTQSLEQMKGCETLVINALRREPHISHFTLAQALEIIAILKPKNTYLTHISHALGKHDEINKTLPANVSLAYDGLKINIAK
ncbi:MAG: MBL fold metallo-hydrolase [Bacteroidales bacterium]